jgi:hypothetical protein
MSMRDELMPFVPNDYQPQAKELRKLDMVAGENWTTLGCSVCTFVRLVTVVLD